ncbi:MAG: VTT domain-containing protein [Clostridia bacterium]|nr:VTT domain-containing protein [Clostridia bacterium]
MEETLSRITELIDIIHPIIVCAVMFFMAVLQYFFPPVPSDTLLVAIGVISSSDIFLGLQMFIAYALGAMVGSCALYELCLFLGEKAKKLKFVQSMIEGKNLDNAQEKLAKYGGISFFILRFVPTMQVITIVAFGISKVHRKRVYTILIAVGFLGSFVYSLIGYLLGDNLPLIDKLMSEMGAFGWILLGIIVIVIASIYIIYKLKNKKNK